MTDLTESEKEALTDALYADPDLGPVLDLRS